MGGVSIVATAGYVALAVVSLALFLAAVRLFRGPSLADRIVALELIAGLMVGVIAVVSIVAEQSVLIDVAIALALVGFLGAVAFAKYIERGSIGGRAPEPGAAGPSSAGPSSAGPSSAGPSTIGQPPDTDV